MNVSLNLDNYSEARSAYSYVPARLVLSSNREPDLVFGNLALSTSCPTVMDWQNRDDAGIFSSLELDDFHRRLLHGADGELLHGLLSAVFWGFASGADGRLHPGRARARASWIINGKSGTIPQLPQEILRILKESFEHLNAGDLQNALTTMVKIQHLGVSFASKVLMFFAPDRAVVYDSIIYSLLRDSDDMALRSIAVDPARRGGSSLSRQASAYASWCHHCTDLARALERAGMSWTDWNGKRVSHWRAVDVERAFFVLGGRAKRGSS